MTNDPTTGSAIPPAPPTYEASQSDGFTQLSMRIEELGRQIDRYSQSIDDRLRRLELSEEIKRLKQRNAIHKANHLTLVSVPRWDGERPHHLPRIGSAAAMSNMDMDVLRLFVDFYSEVAYPPGMSRTQMLVIIWHSIGDGPWDFAKRGYPY